MEFSRIISIMVAVLVIATAAYAQPLDTLWTKTYGGTEAESGNWGIVTDDGGYLICANTSSYGAGGIDIWILKTDEFGDTIWTKTYGGVNNDLNESIKPTTDGGYILSSTTDSFGAGGSDIRLLKMDSDCDTLWTHTYGGSANEYAGIAYQTADGGYFDGGSTWSYGSGEVDFWLFKTDASGNMQWSESWGGGQGEHGRFNIVTNDGGYALVGETWSYAPYSNVWMVKTDGAGNEQWIANFGIDQVDYGMAVQQTMDGGYIITGFSGQYWSVDDDLLLAKLNSSGAVEWTRAFGGSENEWGRYVLQLDDGGYLVAGYTESYGMGDMDGWVIRTDDQGYEIWSQTFGGTGADMIRRIVEIEPGEYLLIGDTESYGAGSTDVWLIRVSMEAPSSDVIITLTPFTSPVIIPASGGSFEFNAAVENRGTSACTVDVWTEIRLPETGSMPVWNYTGLELPIDVTISRDRYQEVPGYAPAGEYTYYAYTGTYPWIVIDSDSFVFTKLGSDGGGSLGSPEDWKSGGESFAVDPADEENQPAAGHLGIHPNPFNATASFSYQLPEAGHVNLSVYDVAGRLVTELVDGQRIEGWHEVAFDASSMPSGMYLARLTTDRGQHTQKLLLIK